MISNWASGRELGKTSPDAPLYIFGATSLIGKRGACSHFMSQYLDVSSEEKNDKSKKRLGVF